jgi:hypothetical protein
MSLRRIRAARYQFTDLRHARLFPMAVILLLADCAGPMGTLQGYPPPPPPVTAFDGSYRSTIRVAAAFGQVAQTTTWCDTPGQSTVTVANGELRYSVPHPNIPGNATPTFPATMAQDGSFSGEVVLGTISGQISGTHMQGQIDGSACLYTFAGERI